MKKSAFLFLLILNIFQTRVVSQTIELNTANFKKICKEVIHTGKYPAGTVFELTEDIVIDEEWEELGSAQTPFTAILEGNGKTIYSEEEDFILFHTLQGATVQNLQILLQEQEDEKKQILPEAGIAESAKKAEKSFYQGTIARKAYKSILRNCICKMDHEQEVDKNETGYLGGFLGFSQGTTITDCIYLSSKLETELANAGSKCKAFVGGLIGYSEDDSTYIYNNLVVMPEITFDKNSHNCLVGSICGNWEEAVSGNELISFGSEIKLIDLNNVVSEGNVLYVTNSTIELTENMKGNVILLNTTEKDLNIQMSGNIICLRNSVGRLTLGPNTRQTGYISSESIVLYDGCLISTYGIDNHGDIFYYRQPAVWTQYDPATGSGKGDGWESLWLPFDATLMAGSGDRFEYYSELNPLTENGGNYWLRSYEEFKGDSAVFADAGIIRKNTAYIIALPGESWGKYLSLEGKTILFKGSGPVFANHDMRQPIQTEEICFQPNPTSRLETKSCYTLNSFGETHDANDILGNCFIRKESVTLTPFRAVFETRSSNSPYLRIVAGKRTTTQLLPVRNQANIKAFGFNGELIIESDGAQRIGLYSATGTLIRWINLLENRTVISDLPNGVYIIGNQKVSLS